MSSSVKVQEVLYSSMKSDCPPVLGAYPSSFAPVPGRVQAAWSTGSLTDASLPAHTAPVIRHPCRDVRSHHSWHSKCGFLWDLLGQFWEINKKCIWPGPRFNIKMPSYQYRKPHCGDKTVIRSSYLQNGISYTGKTTSLYWIRALFNCWLLSWKKYLQFCNHHCVCWCPSTISTIRC